MGNSILDERNVAYNWGSESNKIRGVNIGGWLVLEPYATLPQLFLFQNANTLHLQVHHTIYFLALLQ